MIVNRCWNIQLKLWYCIECILQNTDTSYECDTTKHVDALTKVTYILYYKTWSASMFTSYVCHNFAIFPSCLNISYRVLLYFRNRSVLDSRQPNLQLSIASFRFLLKVWNIANLHSIHNIKFSSFSSSQLLIYYGLFHRYTCLSCLYIYSWQAFRYLKW